MTRYLTIQKRKLKKHWFYNIKKELPEIRFGGLWLAEQGFYPKGKIKITVKRGYLNIELSPKNHENATI